MTVIDAGVVIKLVAGELDLTIVEHGLSAPHLIDSEVTHALRRLVTSGRLGRAQGQIAFDAFRQLTIRRWTSTPLLPRMWELRHNLSGYDATYAALAESLDEPLLTTDRGLAGAPGLRCLVEVV